MLPVLHAAAAVLFTCALTACSSSSSGATTAISGSMTQTLAPVPKVADGAAAFCADFVADKTLRALPSAMRAAATGDPTGVAALKSAATQLRTFSSTELGATATRTAQALDALAVKPTDVKRLNAVAAAAQALDVKVGQECGTS